MLNLKINNFTCNSRDEIKLNKDLCLLLKHNILNQISFYLIIMAVQYIAV